MRTLLLSPALFSPALLVACGAGKGAAGSEWALAFSGPTDCATANVADVALPDALTVEAWVRGGAGSEYAVHPVVAWTGAFALYEDVEGTGWFSDGTGDLGASFPDGWVADTALHHVAGTLDGSTAFLFVDGIRVAYVTDFALGPAPSSALGVGCWTAKEGWHEGVIDEVRLSSAVRYEDDFDLPDGPFEPDSATIALWHFDEGQGEVALDEMQGHDLDLEGVEWVELPFGSEEE